MSHLKKDFKYHKLFDNKYKDNTYYAYLYRYNTEYLPRSNSWLSYHAYCFIDFVIRSNNYISRRGKLENVIPFIKKELDGLLSYERYELKLVYGDFHGTISSKYGNVYELKKFLESLPNKMEVHLKEIDLIDKLLYWQGKVETNFSGFMDFVYDVIIDFDSNNYGYIYQDGYIFDRSLRDNELKRTYCTLNNEKNIKSFKDFYFGKVCVESSKKNILYKQISYMLIIIADINNYLIANEYDSCIELLSDYLSDNYNMKSCIDIYYLKTYKKLEEVLTKLKNEEYKECENILTTIIEIENEKYKEIFNLFSPVAIDIKDSIYSKIVNI